MFISIDGIDGGGKSTQIELLCQWLRNQQHRVQLFRDPGSTPLGESIRDILLHREEIPLSLTAEMLLYMAARAQLVEQAIRPALAIGDTVVCDRYLLANVAYQAAGGGLDIEELWGTGSIATRGLKPDLTIVLDLPAEVAASRISGSQDRLEKRGLEYFQRVREGFLSQMHRGSKVAVAVDATQSIDIVHQQIVDAIGGYKS